MRFSFLCLISSAFQFIFKTSPRDLHFQKITTKIYIELFIEKILLWAYPLPIVSMIRNKELKTIIRFCFRFLATFSKNAIASIPKGFDSQHWCFNMLFESMLDWCFWAEGTSSGVWGFGCFIFIWNRLNKVVRLHSASEKMLIRFFFSGFSMSWTCSFDLLICCF